MAPASNGALLNIHHYYHQPVYYSIFLCFRWRRTDVIVYIKCPLIKWRSRRLLLIVVVSSCGIHFKEVVTLSLCACLSRVAMEHFSLDFIRVILIMLGKVWIYV